jgi:hypothetical protein
MSSTLSTATYVTCNTWANLGANSICVSTTTVPRFQKKQAHHLENSQWVNIFANLATQKLHSQYYPLTKTVDWMQSPGCAKKCTGSTSYALCIHMASMRISKPPTRCPRCNIGWCPHIMPHPVPLFIHTYSILPIYPLLCVTAVLYNLCVSFIAFLCLPVCPYSVSVHL